MRIHRRLAWLHARSECSQPAIRRIPAGRISRVAVGVLLVVLLATLSGSMERAAAAQTGKVVVIVLENERYDDIVGNSQAPYLNQLIARGALFTNYAAVVGSSNPNYLAMTSGLASALSPPSPNIFQALDGTGGAFHWKEFMESAPGTCAAGTSAQIPGTNVPLYTADHDPAYAYRADTTCSTNDVPMTTSTFNPANLPDFSYIVPNQCDDMHTLPGNGSSCPAYFGPNSGSSLVNMGDNWLAKVVPQLIAQPNVTVLITWDEGSNQTSPPQHIVTLAAGAGILPGSADSTAYTHYSLEAGLYSYFGLGTAPNNGATATPLPIPPAAPPAQPTISSFQPASGPAGTSVTILGTAFTGATGVSFAGTPASSFAVSSDTQITATVPSGAITGSITVSTPGGTASSTSSFTVTPPAPVISTLSPTTAPVGASITVTGSNFTNASSVTLNGASTAFSVTSDTQLAFTVPSSATSGPVAVTTPNGTGSSPTPFTVAVAPTISSFTPSSGTIGTRVSVTGAGFTTVTQVTLNGISAGYSITSDTQLSFVVPAAASGPIALITPYFTTTSQSSFTITDLAVSAAPSSITISRGGNAAYAVSVTPINGFTGPVTLTANSLPSGAKATFSPNPVTISTSTVSSTFTISTTRSIKPGTYTITISAAGGHIARTSTVTLIVKR